MPKTVTKKTPKQKAQSVYNYSKKNVIKGTFGGGIENKKRVVYGDTELGHTLPDKRHK